MRALLGIIIIAVLLWSGWWYLGATAQKTALNAWFDNQSRAGWVAEREDISVSGYPNRIDATVSDLMLADPRSGWAWSAPFFQVLMLSYQPNHAIAVWPDTQKISSPAGTATVTSDRMRGSVVFVPDTDLTLDRTQIEMQNVTIAGDGWLAALAQGNMATRRMGEGEAPGFAHQFGLEATDLAVPGVSEFLKKRAAKLPTTMEKARVDLIASFDAPWDRHAVEGKKPQLTALRIKEVDVLWGKLRLLADGLLEVDRDGFPVGKIDIEAQQWRDMLKVAEAAGVLPRSIVDTAEDALGIVELLSGKKDTIKVPLSFKNSLMLLGPVPVGQAPRLIIR